VDSRRGDNVLWSFALIICPAVSAWRTGDIYALSWGTETNCWIAGRRQAEGQGQRSWPQGAERCGQHLPAAEPAGRAPQPPPEMVDLAVRCVLQNLVDKLPPTRYIIRLRSMAARLELKGNRRGLIQESERVVSFKTTRKPYQFLT